VRAGIRTQPHGAPNGNQDATASSDRLRPV
jgi:hypothetical protein